MAGDELAKIVRDAISHIDANDLNDEDAKVYMADVIARHVIDKNVDKIFAAVAESGGSGLLASLFPENKKIK